MNAFDLQAVLTMDSSAFDRGLDRAGSALSALAGVSVAAVGAAAAGVVSLTTQSVEAYGEYEQMAGGIERLFGSAGLSLEDYAAREGRTVSEVREEYESLQRAQERVMQDAANAYATAGMSANEYMETATAFSSTLIRQLDGDTERAAELANIAIRDMSDNVNTFGTDMESVQSAYRGAMRGNFTMIDNLMIGYDGTKVAMLDLINESGIFEEHLDSLADVGFDDMIMAIHQVQTEMGISGLSAEEAAAMVASGAMTQEEAYAAMGTTAREAATTIQGSMSMLSASWENLLIGLGDSEADLGGLVDNLVDSFMAVVNNVTPVALNAIQGIADVITQLAPIIEENLPTMIDSVLPALTSAITAIVNGVIAVLPSLVSTLGPPLFNSAIQVVSSLVEILPELINTITEQIPVLLGDLVPAIISVTPLILDAGFQLLLALMEGFADNIEMIVTAVTDMIMLISTTMLSPENIELFFDAWMQICEAMYNAIINNLPFLIEAVVYILSNVLIAMIEFFPNYLDALISFNNSIVSTVGEKLGVVGSVVTNGLTTIGGFITDGLERWHRFFVNIFDTISDFISNGIDSWSDFFSNGFDNIYNIITGVLDNVSSAFSSVFENIRGVVSAGVQTLIDLFDFDWSLPRIALPHFNIQGGELPWGIGGQGTPPSISVDWYAKAYGQPYMLDGATIFGSMGGKMLGGGEGNGKELIVGWDQLMSKISEASQPIVDVHVYIGGTEVDDFVVDSKQRADFIGGGRG